MTRTSLASIAAARAARAVGVAASAFVIAACSGSTSSSTPTPATSSSTSTTTTATATAPPPAPTLAPTTTLPATTVPSTSPPTTQAPTTTPPSTIAVVDLAGDDWEPIIETLLRRKQALYANPTADRLSWMAVCITKEGSCGSTLSVQLPDMYAKGLRFIESDPYVVLPGTAEIERIDEGQTVETSRAVSIIVTVERLEHAGVIVDAAGEVQADVVDEGAPEGQNPRFRFLLARISPADEWRILDQIRVTTVPG